MLIYLHKNYVCISEGNFRNNLLPVATILSLRRSGRGEDCTLILHNVFENSALKVLSTEFEVSALATKKKNNLEISLILEIFPSCIKNCYNEWKNAFWRNGKGNTLKQLIGTGMAALQKV